MKKVALLKSRFSHRGGLEKYTLKIAQAFAAAHCHVTLLTSESEEPLPRLAGIDIVPVSKTSKFTLYHLLSFDAACKKWLKENPQDISFGLERTTCQTHYRAGSGVHKAYLKQRELTDHWLKCFSFSLNPLHYVLVNKEQKTFESSELKCLFTNSLMVKEEILNNYTTPSEKITVVHNGVEWKEWESAFHSSFDFPKKDPFHFLFIGNGYERKGLSFFLKGLAQLASHDFIVSVVGKDKNISYFKELAKSLSLEKQVIFYGPQRDILPFYQTADVLVIPSIYDPFANVTVEALAMGLFVVSSKYNGGKEVLTEKTGVLIDNLLSPESVAEALKKALNHPKTAVKAAKIRSSIQELDFSHQLNKIVQKSLDFV